MATLRFQCSGSCRFIIMKATYINNANGSTSLPSLSELTSTVRNMTEEKVKLWKSRDIAIYHGTLTAGQVFTYQSAELLQSRLRRIRNLVLASKLVCCQSLAWRKPWARWQPSKISFPPLVTRTLWGSFKMRPQNCQSQLSNSEKIFGTSENLEKMFGTSEI